LIFLRARWYNPADGRFQSRDTGEGSYNSPQSLNRWNYTEGNPVNYTDPTGYIKEGSESQEAELILEKLNNFYDVEIKKDWGYLNEFVDTDNFYINSSMICEWLPGNWRSVDELRYVLKAVNKAAQGMGGPSKFRSAMNNNPVRVTRISIDGDDFRHRALPIVDIVYSNYAMTNEEFIIYSTIHELGHVWDIRTGFRLSEGLAIVAGPYYCTGDDDLWGEEGEGCFYDPNREPPPGDPNPKKNYVETSFLHNEEDWAESFANYIDPSYYLNKGSRGLGPIRRRYVQDQIKAIP